MTRRVRIASPKTTSLEVTASRRAESATPDHYLASWPIAWWRETGEPGGASAPSLLTLDTLDPLLCARLSLAPDSPALRATRPSPGAPAPSPSQSASFAYLMGCYARAKDDAG